MRVLITGLNGTVAPKVARAFASHGTEIIGWNRGDVPPDGKDAAARFLERARPDAILHLAMGGETWAGGLARYAGANGIPFLFTSSAMVFGNNPDGPHRPGDDRTTTDDYGRYKIRCEDVVLAHNPDAIIARFGWQIDPDARGNNMLAHLDTQQSRDGKIEAGRRWIPACSFMEDTAETLRTLIINRASGVFHIDSNARDAWPFDRIAKALQKRFARTGWIIDVTGTYIHDQRLIGSETDTPRISDRLKE